MKKPLIKQCPCCEMPIIYEGQISSVQPECLQVDTQEGTMQVCLLYWQCRACGCKWQHGQFDKKKK